MEADVEGASVAIILQKLKKQVQANRQSHVKVIVVESKLTIRLWLAQR